MSFFGVGVNLVLFLTRVMRQTNATAANNVSIWTGTVYLFSLFGAFLSDSYLGRYLTCFLFQLVLVAVCMTCIVDIVYFTPFVSTLPSQEIVTRIIGHMS